MQQKSKKGEKTAALGNVFCKNHQIFCRHFRMFYEFLKDFFKKSSKSKKQNKKTSKKTRSKNNEQKMQKQNKEIYTIIFHLCSFWRVFGANFTAQRVFSPVYCHKMIKTHKKRWLNADFSPIFNKKQVKGTFFGLLYPIFTV